MRDLVYRTMLTAQMNACFWNRLSRRYSTREKYTKIFLAATSSGAVAGWTIWTDHAVVWKVLSALSALVAVALPILDYSGQVEKMTKLASGYSQLRISYDQLWARIDTMPSDAVIQAVEKLAQQEIALSDVQGTLPDDSKLLGKCQDEVMKSRGLQTV